MFPTLARRLAVSAPRPVQATAILRTPPPSGSNNPYKARKVWPPDFSALNAQQQLRFEKKYKRRLQKASYSPKWDKGLKYAQLATMAAALVWLFFYAEFEWWGRTYKPYHEMQKHARNILGVEWPSRPNIQKDGDEKSTSKSAPESK